MRWLKRCQSHTSERSDTLLCSWLQPKGEAKAQSHQEQGFTRSRGDTELGFCAVDEPLFPCSPKGTRAVTLREAQGKPSRFTIYALSRSVCLRASV